jgi:hypothetical protein
MASVPEDNDFDDCEIPLEDDEGKELKDGASPDEGVEPLPCRGEEEPPKQLTPHQIRMQQLLLKMNQARQLNRQAVQEEGSAQVKPNKSATSRPTKVKPNPVTSMQAADVIQQAQRRAERQEAAQHSMHDFHSPEAQHRQYQRSVKSIRHAASAPCDSTEDTFDPLLANRDKEAERQGAHRLAQEMHRRIEKKRKNEAKKKDKEEDVAGHINKRNKQFNKKLDRNYQDHVKEIQQNLERGTAL